MLFAALGTGRIAQPELVDEAVVAASHLRPKQVVVSIYTCLNAKQYGGKSDDDKQSNTELPAVIETFGP